MEETITITQKNFRELVRRDTFLTALEHAGVDNWDGYDYAMELLDGEE